MSPSKVLRLSQNIKVAYTSGMIVCDQKRVPSARLRPAYKPARRSPADGLGVFGDVDATVTNAAVHATANAPESAER
jgi:hypothetical protein